MLVSLSWLKKYVDIPTDAKTLMEDLTMAGLKVERMLSSGIADPAIVVGEVMSVERHPNADKLTVCRVRVDGGSPREIICGAPNVAAGQMVPVALPGATLPTGMKIKPTRIRGVTSNGMICSEVELGVGKDAAGILVLGGDLEVGRPLSESVFPPDELFELEVTPNRPDHLSHIGVAREVSAIYKLPLRLPFRREPETADPKRGGVTIDIADAVDCPRYVGKRVDGVRVGPSPPWLAGALTAVGLNSVNNIVDVANYVMMEIGQPLHAFDFHQIEDSRIVVRRAENGEHLKALDELSYELSDGMLVIADEKRPVALAGVIGGLTSAVRDDTVDILIESAKFQPQLVRRTKGALNLATDAAYRFERGTDPNGCLIAAERAAELIVQVAGGEPLPAVDAYPEPVEPLRLTVRAPHVSRLLGATLSVIEVGAILDRLGFASQGATADSLSVEVPTYRVDILEEADLVEEVARLYGYQRIGRGWGYRCTTYAQVDPLEAFEEAVADHLASRGFTEVLTSSFTDAVVHGDFGWGEDDPRMRPIEVRNPLTKNHRYLRTSLLPGMLDVVRGNMDQGIKRQKIFQYGRVFLSQEGPQKLPDEVTTLAILWTNPSRPDFWNNSKGSTDLFDIKKEVEVMLRAFKIDLGSDLLYNFDEATGVFTYSAKDGILIEGGILPEPLRERYDFDQAVWYVSADMIKLYGLRATRPTLKPLPEYPVSKRDLSLVAGEGVVFADIERLLARSGGRLLESLQVFDVYRGETIEAGRTAYGVRLHFRSPTRTLTDEEIDQIIDKIVTKLKNELNVELRS